MQLLTPGLHHFPINSTYKCHLECLTLTELLQTIRKNEGIVHLIGLEDVQATIERDLPSKIGHDMTRVDGARESVTCYVNRNKQQSWPVALGILEGQCMMVVHSRVKDPTYTQPRD